MTPNTALMIAAVLAQGAIALLLLWAMGMVRLPLVRAGTIRVPDIALSRDPWPDNEKRVSNAFDNQFQLPVLFYVAVGLSLYFAPTLFEVVLAWLFVLSRIGHAIVHAARNDVGQRFAFYTFGYAVLIVLWVDLAVRLIFTAAHPAA